MVRLCEKGLVEKTKYYGKVLGWQLTDDGIDLIEEMGPPKQYDH